MTSAFGYDCNNRHKLEADGEDAARQTLPYDQGIPLGYEQPVAHPTNVRAREAIEKIKAETNGKVEIQLRLEKPDQRTPAWA